MDQQERLMQILTTKSKAVCIYARLSTRASVTSRQETSPKPTKIDISAHFAEMNQNLVRPGSDAVGPVQTPLHSCAEPN